MNTYIPTYVCPDMQMYVYVSNVMQLNNIRVARHNYVYTMYLIVLNPFIHINFSLARLVVYRAAVFL